MRKLAVSYIVLHTLAGFSWAGKYEGAFKKASERVAVNMADKAEIKNWCEALESGVDTVDEFLDFASEMKLEREKPYPAYGCVAMIPMVCPGSGAVNLCYRIDDCSTARWGSKDCEYEKRIIIGLEKMSANPDTSEHVREFSNKLITDFRDKILKGDCK